MVLVMVLIQTANTLPSFPIFRVPNSFWSCVTLQLSGFLSLCFAYWSYSWLGDSRWSQYSPWLSYVGLARLVWTLVKNWLRVLLARALFDWDWLLSLRTNIRRLSLNVNRDLAWLRLNLCSRWSLLRGHVMSDGVLDLLVGGFASHWVSVFLMHHFAILLLFHWTKCVLLLYCQGLPARCGLWCLVCINNFLKSVLRALMRLLWTGKLRLVWVVDLDSAFCVALLAEHECIGALCLWGSLL